LINPDGSISDIGTKNKKYIAFFDLDQTLITVNSGRLVTRQAFREGILPPKKIGSALITGLLYRTGLMKPETAISRLAQLMAGVPVRQFEDLSNRVFKSVIRASITAAARREVEWHRENNGATAIISAALPYICRAVQAELAIEDLICTEPEVIDGVFSGRFTGRYCFGREKLLRAERYCAQRGFRPNQAWYYADSVSDIPLLEQVGHPVCVNPGKNLHRLARQCGWEIREWQLSIK
jgi:HAD superfamily hydrolase (TIGR01490 family)